MPKLPIKKIIFFCIFFSFYSFAYSEDKGAIIRIIRYDFSLRNTTGKVIPKAKFWAYAPVKENSTQKAIELKTFHPYELIIDEKGNQVLYFTFSNIPPG